MPNGDVFIHAGDFSSVGKMNEVEKFRDYLVSLPHPSKIVIAGNHDVTFQVDWYNQIGYNKFHRGVLQDAVACKNLLRTAHGITYLEDSACEVAGLKVWGSPWQPEFCGWAFNCERGEAIRKYWDLIPQETDILITHGPPLGHGDKAQYTYNVGCEELLKAVERVKPLVHVFGHIHEGYGVTTSRETAFVNASTCTDRYRPTNPCKITDLARTD